MKNILFAFAILISLSCCSDFKENEYTYEQFMDEVSIEVPPIGDSIHVKAKSSFSYIEFVQIIQNGDSIKRILYKKGQSQISTDDWYTVESILRENEMFPSSIKIVLKVNITGSERSLIIRVVNGNRFNDLKITQPTDLKGGDSHDDIMETLSATIPAAGDFITIKAIDQFFYAHFVTAIQDGDTIRKSLDTNETPQVVTDSWFTIKTICKENEMFPSSLNVFMTKNTTDSERFLVIGLTKGNSRRMLTITQKKAE